MAKYHPRLNIQLSQQIVVESTFDVAALPLEEHWQTLLLNLFQVTCGWDEVRVLEYAGHLQRHIGSDASFKYKPELIRNLKIIYARLTNQLGSNFPEISELEQARIITPIADDIAFCTTGFYNRAESTVRQMMLPQTLPALMMRVRIGLVDRVARRISSDIHVNTRAMTIANALGFGVPVINAADPYQGDFVLNNLITDRLLSYIPDEFRPFPIISQLVDQIKIAITLHGYEGKKIARTPHESSETPHYGYKKGEYEPFKAYLRLMLGPVVNDANLFILDEKYQVVDLDWFVVKSLLWTRLVHDGYFEHPVEWIQPFDIDDLLFNADSIQVLFSQPYDFLQCLGCFPELSLEKIKSLSRLYIDGFLTQQPHDKNKLMAILLAAIGGSDEPSHTLLFDVLKERYMAELIHFLFSEHGNDSRKALQNSYRAYFSVLVGMVPHLSSVIETDALLQINRILAYAIKKKPTQTILDLLNKVSKLAPAELARILMQAQGHSGNLLTLAMENHQKVRVIERIIELSVNIHSLIKTGFIHVMLSTENNEGYNAVTLAAKAFARTFNHLEAEEGAVSDAGEDSNPILNQLVSLMEWLTPEQNGTIFTQYNVMDGNNLMMMMLNETALCQRLLNMMAALEPSDKNRMVKQCNTDGYNVLMLAISDAPESLGYLLDWMSAHISDWTMCLLLNQKPLNSDFNETAYTMLVSMENPQRPIQPIHQSVLKFILLQMRMPTSKKEQPLIKPNDPLVMLTEELMDCVVRDDVAALKEKFLRYAYMAVNLEVTRRGLFFTVTSRESIANHVSGALRFFDSSLISAVTGGYTNSASLLGDLSPTAGDVGDEQASPNERLNPKMS